MTNGPRRIPRARSPASASPTFVSPSRRTANANCTMAREGIRYFINYSTGNGARFILFYVQRYTFRNQRSCYVSRRKADKFKKIEENCFSIASQCLREWLLQMEWRRHLVVAVFVENLAKCFIVKKHA